MGTLRRDVTNKEIYIYEYDHVYISNQTIGVEHASGDSEPSFSDIFVRTAVLGWSDSTLRILM